MLVTQVRLNFAGNFFVFTAQLQLHVTDFLLLPPNLLISYIRVTEVCIAVHDFCFVLFNFVVHFNAIEIDFIVSNS